MKLSPPILSRTSNQTVSHSNSETARDVQVGTIEIISKKLETELEPSSIGSTLYPPKGPRQDRRIPNFVSSRIVSPKSARAIVPFVFCASSRPPLHSSISIQPSVDFNSSVYAGAFRRQKFALGPLIGTGARARLIPIIISQRERERERENIPTRSRTAAVRAIEYLCI